MTRSTHDVQEESCISFPKVVFKIETKLVAVLR